MKLRKSSPKIQSIQNGPRKEADTERLARGKHSVDFIILLKKSWTDDDFPSSVQESTGLRSYNGHCGQTETHWKIASRFWNIQVK